MRHLSRKIESRAKTKIHKHIKGNIKHHIKVNLAEICHML